MKLLYEKLFGRGKLGEVGQVADPLFTLLDIRFLYHTVHDTNIAKNHIFLLSFHAKFNWL